MAVKHLTTADFTETLASEPAALVDFWAAWCGPCRMLGPVIEHLGEQYEGKALIAKVDTDQSPELARQFMVDVIPTLVFFRNGQEVRRLTGVQPPEALAAALDELL